MSISYRATSFSQLSNLVIRYRLDGLHEEWQELINPRLNVLYFDNLPPGTYQLQLQAGFGNQVFSDIVSSETFRINPPLFLTWWFLLLLFLFTLGLGILIASFWRQYRDKGELRRAIDEKIKEAFTMEEQFRNVWNSSRDGLLLSIEGGKIIAANPALSSLVGLEEKTIEEGYIKDLFTDPLYYDQQRPKILSLIETTSSHSATLELLMPFKAGEKLIEIYATRLNTSFKGKGVLLSVFQDVTELRAYERSLKEAKERAEEANRMKSNFISNISHEIRTPLNGIMGSTEYVISQRKNDAALCRQLEIILESGERLLHTINSILDLSKIEANKVGLEIEEVEVNDFLARLLLPLKTLAMNKGLLLSTKYETPHLKAALDKRYFAMIVNNLVGNAIKYSEKGLIHIRVCQQADQFVFSVHDQGIGMSDHFMEKLFEPFEQESAGYSRTYEGTGLGLAITKNAVLLMGGTIDVSSKKGEGTQVTILLPVEQNQTTT
ncbi:ATP-binding protein [Nitritalea halalkaliphila]|uniref:ATP-binding protein n=1 Tax=Nitritalea halalkaliphila TaxID=590849 RepID=UPI0009FD17A0|nr:ATP-binding protein [Nitritalea halalkaliphila]